MTARSTTQLVGQQFLSIITQFYCSISLRKDLQNISSSIRQFVLINSSITNKEITAKRILDYFLKIQSKMVKKGDKEWDKAFEMATAKSQAMIKIAYFPTRNSLLTAFSRIKQRQKQQTCLQISERINLAHQTCPLQQPLEVQQDIKIKTYYFFKWCQYVQKSKEFKQFKMKDIQNQKISLSFSKYGMKFNYFNAWKRVYKKHKLQRQRARKIQNQSKQLLLKHCIEKMQQVSAIIMIQAQLSKKIGAKMVQLKKKMLYKKLKMNSQRVKHIAQSKKISNLSAFDFINHFAIRLKPLLNKSFQNARIKFDQDHQKLIISKYFAFLKGHLNQVKQKIKDVASLRKAQCLGGWRKDHQKDKLFSCESLNINLYLKKRRKRVVLAILSFNKLLREQEFKKIQDMKQNPLANRSLVYASLKKQIEQKRLSAQKFLNSRYKKRFLTNLKSRYQILLQKINDFKCIKAIYLNQILERFKSKKAYKQQKTKLYRQLKGKFDRKLKSSSFRSWRKIKYYKKIEEESILVIERSVKLIAMSLFWNKFLFRVKQKQCVKRLIDSANWALIKIAFTKIIGRTNLINLKIKSMRLQKEKRYVINLFQLLKKNAKYNPQKAQGIQYFYAKRCESILMRRLHKLMSLKHKTNTSVAKVNKMKVEKFLFKIKNNYKLATQRKTKCQELGKKIFLKFFRRSVNYQLDIQQSIQAKNIKINDKLKQLSVSKFIERLKSNITDKEYMLERQQKILYRISRAGILKIKQYCNKVRNENSLNKRYSVLIKKRKSQVIDIVSIKNKSSKLAAALNSTKFKASFLDFRNQTKKISFIKKSKQILTKSIHTKYKKQFYKCLQADKRQMQQKNSMLQQSKKKRNKQLVKNFVQMLQNHKENIRNSQTLSKQRKLNLFTQFIAMQLQTKFSRIKFNCSLKSYAKNLMKKAFKSLKQAHVKIKHKQNLIKLDRTSSIMMQKSIQKSFKSNTLSQQIERFNLRKSRQIR